MELERRIKKACLAYRKSGVAFIRKIDIPSRIVGGGNVVQMRSCVDFTGLKKGGLYVSFECKETCCKTSFPLKNIHQHQLEYLKLVREFGGEAHFIIWFKKVMDEAYLVPVEFVESRWNGKKRSIPIGDFKDDWKVDVDDFLGVS